MLLLKNFSLDRSELGEKLKLPANVFFGYFFRFAILSSSDNKSLFVADNKTRRTENLLKIFIIYGCCNQGNLLFLRTNGMAFPYKLFLWSSSLLKGWRFFICIAPEVVESLNNSNLILATLIIELQVENLDLNARNSTTHYRVELFGLQCNLKSHKDAIRS